MIHPIPLIHTLAHLFGPWKSAYSNSKALADVVTFAHLGALLFGGGFAIAADRATLRARYTDAPARQRQLDELHAVHRPVLIALSVLFVSGLLMAASDVETFLTSLTFWIKMTLVALLVVNGGILYKTEDALRLGAIKAGSGASKQGGMQDVDYLWGRLRATSVASLVLWTTTVLAGTVLVNS